MAMEIKKLIKNEICLDEEGVWILDGHDKFSYTDGDATEKHLRETFEVAKDLSSTSVELEAYIKDWPSEYHLSSKRAQLLSGFRFDRSSLVLEVGCGCGAITRYLGEQFDRVVSVEGSINRARLARLRSKDLGSISVLCAPFQEIEFQQKFDIIFCIGVFEYSGSFIDGDDPYEEALKYFREMLTPHGTLIVAIENQFGLKYFSCAREDHLGRMFEGLEGYHRQPKKVRTFGKTELQTRLSQHFSNVDFFYPYPDYKIPDCVLSSSFVASGRGGELISQLTPRDYSGPMHRYFDEAATTLELDRNRMLEFFANSFLIVAGVGQLNSVQFPQHGIFYSSGRTPRFATRTRIVEDNVGEMKVTKERKYSAQLEQFGKLQLRTYEAPWIDLISLQTQTMLRARMRRSSLSDIFEPCRLWLSWLTTQAREQDGVLLVGGDHIDSIWGNAYVNGNECHIIDREFVWSEPLPVQVVVIRAIYHLLLKIDNKLPVADDLQTRHSRRLIENIADAIGISLTTGHFEKFISVETELQSQVFGTNATRAVFYLRWYLADRFSLNIAVRFKKGILRLYASRVAPLLTRFLHRK